MNEELLYKLYDAYDYLYIHDGYLDLINKFENDTEACKQKYLRIKNEKTSYFFIYIMIFFTAVIMLMIGGLISTQINFPLLVPILIGIIIFAFICANRFIKSKKKEPENKATEFWNTIGSPTCIENNTKIDKIKDELRIFNHENSHTIDFLPEDYQDDITVVGYLIHVIKNGMADSMKEALNLYVEQKHRWEVEATMRGMANSMEMHNREMEAYMSEISAQQRITNSRLADIEMLTFLDYIN